MKHPFTFSLLSAALMGGWAACTPQAGEPQAEAAPWQVDRFADIAVLRYEVPGFEALSLQQKKLIYYLSEAALWGRDILWSQHGVYNLTIRRLAEAVYTHYDGDRNDANFLAFETYLKQIWFANGIHHHYSAAKFIPQFSEEWFMSQVTRLPESEQMPYLSNEAISRAIFQSDFLPVKTNQAAGVDLVKTSAVNFYEGVSQKEVEAYYAARKKGNEVRPVMFGLNSTLRKDEHGKIYEDTWRLGGLYSKTITHIVEWLKKAETVAENDQQRAVIAQLIKFYETGDLKDFDAYSVQWVADTESRVDFINGFIESYADPLGMRGSWEGMVNFKDSAATARTEIIARNAQWFEDHSPIDPRFRKEAVKGITAKVITAAILAGDSYPSTPIGINLPNSNWIRAEYGSKSVSLDNIMAAYDAAAAGNGFDEEFMFSDVERERARKYGHLVENIHTDLHECLGHGSGKLLPGVDPDALLAYGSTLEEARADIFALYYMADPKLIELGVMPDGEAYKAAYYQQMMNGLMTQLVRIEPGKVLEEAHMRNRALIAYWTLHRAATLAQEKGTQPAMEIVKRDGKSYVEIHDYEALRTMFGELLGELQRIKSEGDFASGQQLVETYGVKIDADLHNEMLARYQRLNLAPYKGFVNPRYEPVFNGDGQLVDVKITYGTESYVEQMLRYSRDYSAE